MPVNYIHTLMKIHITLADKFQFLEKWPLLSIIIIGGLV